jgi:hypothetical protein
MEGQGAPENFRNRETTEDLGTQLPRDSVRRKLMNDPLNGRTMHRVFEIEGDWERDKGGENKSLRPLMNDPLNGRTRHEVFVTEDSAKKSLARGVDRLRGYYN